MDKKFILINFTCRNVNNKFFWNILLNNYNKLINKIISNSYNHYELENFVNLCTSISAAYLKNELYYNRVYFPIVLDNDNEIKDISLDLIAPLFERDQSNSFKIFKNQLLTKPDQQESLFDRLKSIIISKTRQELIQRFKEEEPGGYKILRNIKLAPTRNKNIKKFEDQFNTYLYYCEKEYQEPLLDHLNAELPEIAQEELNELARVAAKNDTIIPKILENILVNIKKNSSCRDFIELSYLFKTIKTVMLYTTSSIDNVYENIEYNNNHNGEYYNSSIFKEMEDYIVLIVKDKYQNNGKINEKVASYYELVLTEYFKDLIHAHNNNTLPHYFNNANRDFIADDNFTQHKTRIEYLVKNCKNKLAEVISKY